MIRYHRFATVLSIIFLMAIALAACNMPASNPNQPQSNGSETPPTTTQDLQTPDTGTGTATISGLASVDSIEILTLESFPVQIQVIARGNLPDGCTTIDETLSERTDTLFRVTITTERPSEAACTEALVPFEHVIGLDVFGLPAGEYEVDVNGVKGSFELAMDNIPQTSETPTSNTGTASIRGTVWHDLCSVAGGVGDTPEIPSAGCRQLENGTFLANGRLDEGEPRLEGIEVNLGAGACPSTGLAETKTSNTGQYIFENLAAGTYCVAINSESLNNGPILIPGTWSAPAPDKSETEVILEDGQEKRGVSFGWDFELLPEPEDVQDESNCTNKAAFEEDVTIPDDTQVPGGLEFTKVWRLRNDGTCTWNTAYSLVFTDGDQMGANSPMPLDAPVAPDEEVELSVTFTAPAKAGTYRSEWLLRSAFGQEFGTGRGDDEPVFVQVQVIESTADLDLGEPTWREFFDNSARWFLVNSGNTLFSIENGEMVMESYSPGSFDEWGISNYGVISDFFMEATFRTGDECSGLDRYGLLLRSPDPNQGYVFAFSCDGRYRLYGWDGTYNGLVEWTTNTNIKSGPDSTNKMGVLMEGDTIKLYANGSLLAELEDELFNRGQFGLFVASGSTPNYVTYVEDMTLWELDN